MKRLFCLLLLFMFLPVPFSGCAEAELLWEDEAVIRNAQDKETDAALLRDGSDETGLTLKRGTKANFFVILPDDSKCTTLYIRMNALPVSVEIQKQENRRWQTICNVTEPGAEFALNGLSLSGRLQVLLTFPSALNCTVTEVRCFTDGELPAALHAWRQPEETDVLLLADTPDSFPAELAAELNASGISVAAAFMQNSSDPLSDFDRLWKAGIRTVPGFINTAKSIPEEEKLAHFLRTYQPRLLVTSDEQAALTETAGTYAADPFWQTDEAAEKGLCILYGHCTYTEDAAALLASLPARSSDALRARCAEPFASAQHGDPASIPYPSERQADGYLPAGSDEFLFEDPENGLWAYLSQTVQVEIIKYHMPEVPHTWFEADVHFNPESEQFRQHLYVNASFPNQQIYPETLAQTSKLVFAVNGDYYPYRVERKTNTGNIIRNRQVLYTFNPKKPLKYPILDTVALRDDGSISVYAGDEYTADELLAQGDIHDTLSFGPYLARNGKLRIYNGDSTMVAEPRLAFGTVEPGHYRFVMVEGKMPKHGEQGMGLIQLAMLLYARGVNDAINIDGGSTAVMIFMGHKLNRTGKATSVGSPRNQHELFGVGSSELVHTDMVNGK